MSFYTGEMPPNGIPGKEKKSVQIETIEPQPPQGWLAHAKFEVAADELVVGYEHFYQSEMELMAVIINLYGFTRS